MRNGQIDCDFQTGSGSIKSQFRKMMAVHFPLQAERFGNDVEAAEIFSP